jgi:gas vesicle protein
MSVGVGMTLVFAPMSGKETRAALADFARKLAARRKSEDATATEIAAEPVGDVPVTSDESAGRSTPRRSPPSRSAAAAPSQG